MPQSSDEDTLEPNSPRDGQNGQADGGENGEKGKQPDGPVGFWNSDLKSVRLDVFKNWLITSTSFSYPRSNLSDLWFSSGTAANTFFQP
jgi:hypothetical protein